jgi:uncharacterized protein YcbK (DUF882 family)
MHRSCNMTRRRFLSFAAWGATAAVFPRVARASTQAPALVRRVALHNLHPGESLTTIYWERGAYVPAAFEEISTILRDHRTGEARQMAPGLIDLAHELTACLGTAQPVQIVSGYRSPATNALLHAGDPGKVALNSLHLTGEALDLCIESRSLSTVYAAALSLHRGGVGYYPATGFVHVDIGRPRTW